MTNINELISQVRNELNDRYFGVDFQNGYFSEIEAVIGNHTVGELTAGIKDEEVKSELARQFVGDDVATILCLLAEREVISRLEAAGVANARNAFADVSLIIT